MTRVPLLTLDQACIESGRSTAGPWSASGGQRLVAVVGYFSPFFRVLRGEARLVQGAVRLADQDATRALRAGQVALASQEAPSLPWTTERYLYESARLSLLVKRPAEARVRDVLASLGLTHARTTRLRDLSALERRLVSLGRAALGNPEVLCAEAPLSELDATSEARVTDVLERLATATRLVVSFPAAPLGGRARELFDRADFLVWIRGGTVSAS